MWINKLKSSFLNIISPQKCLGCQKPGKLICESCSRKIFQLSQSPLLKEKPPFQKIIIALDYQNPLVSKIIKSYKYAPYFQSLKKALSQALVSSVRQFPSELKYLQKNKFVLVPVPLHSLKLAQRGFNQSELIAQEISTALSLKINSQILKKIKNTTSQTHLDAQQRKENVRHSFQCPTSTCPPRLILIDDIFTSGATLTEAAYVLQKAGAQEIWAFVLAHG
jgi:ComF family protein